MDFRVAKQLVTSTLISLWLIPAAFPICEAQTAATNDQSINENQAATDEGRTSAGYIRVVPKDTKIPIEMITSLTSEADEPQEFSARTIEDLTIDGAVVIPKGSIVQGTMKVIGRKGISRNSCVVEFHFDTITRSRNGEKYKIVARIVARGGVAHIRRGLKDIALTVDPNNAPSPNGGAKSTDLRDPIFVQLSGRSWEYRTGTKSRDRRAPAWAYARVGGDVYERGKSIFFVAKKVVLISGDELKIQLDAELPVNLRMAS